MPYLGSGGKYVPPKNGRWSRGERNIVSGQPPPALREHLVRGLVDAVEVGTFLAVHLHVHERLVHQRGGAFVLERLVRHHVAPVARGVADGQQDGLVLGARSLERLGAPGIPVHGVVRVLQEVGTRLAGETIRASIGIRTMHGAARRSDRMQALYRNGRLIDDARPGHGARMARICPSCGSSPARTAASRPATCGSSATRWTRRARRSRPSPPAPPCRVVGDRDRFLGYAYVNPHALICARILSRDGRLPAGKVALCAPAAGGACAARAPVRGAVLPPRLRGIRRAAGPRARPLRRRDRRTDRHGRHGGCARTRSSRRSPR